MKLKRRLEVRTPVLKGGDVVAVQRALNRWATPAVAFPISARFDRKTSDRLQAFQLAEGVRPASGELGQKTLDELVKHMDRYGRMRYRTFRPPPVKTAVELKFDELVAAAKILSENTPGYLYGGGHGIPIEDVEVDQGLDCSSSTAKMLDMVDLWPFAQAIVSGEFYRWGKPGKGKLFTIYYNGEHVWTRLSGSRRWWRFDTSPHRDPAGSGPRLRVLPRFTFGFGARHWPGM